MLRSLRSYQQSSTMKASLNTYLQGLYQDVRAAYHSGPLTFTWKGQSKTARLSEANATSGPLVFFIDFLIGSRARLEKTFTMKNASAVVICYR